MQCVILITDIDECDIADSCLEGHCVNSNGGYYCLTVDSISTFTGYWFL